LVTLPAVTTTQTIISVLVSGVSSAPTANAFAIPGFESGNLFPWTVTQNPNEPYPAAQPLAQHSEMHSGSYALYVDTPSGRMSELTEAIQITPWSGQYYYLQLAADCWRLQRSQLSDLVVISLGVGLSRDL